MIIAKKLIKNAVGMYQFTFTPSRLLSSHREVEAHVVHPREVFSLSPFLSVSALSQPPGSFSLFLLFLSRSCMSCSRARPFTLPLILLPLSSALIVPFVSLRSVVAHNLNLRDFARFSSTFVHRRSFPSAPFVALYPTIFPSAITFFSGAFSPRFPILIAHYSTFSLSLFLFNYSLHPFHPSSRFLFGS